MPKEKPTIYLETSVISAYFDFWQKNPKQKEITRRFWQKVLPKHKVYVSRLNVRELTDAKSSWQNYYLKLIEGYEFLGVTDKADELARKYVEAGIIPQSKLSDAAHLAIACLDDIDYLVTWNIRHLARPYKINQIIEFNTKHKIYIPTIAKPSDFL